MGHNAFLLENIVLIVVCIIMPLIFIVIPLPRKKGLKNYRISLRFLAFSYFTLSFLTLLNLLFDNEEINFPIDLTTISLQTILYAFSLITLLNSNFANTPYVLKHLSPTLIFIFLSVVFGKFWGNPTLHNFDDFVMNSTHPSVLLNMLFLLFCIAQLIYFLGLFISQEKKYELKLDDYYADKYRLSLIWVRYCFYGAFALATLVTISLFISTPTFGLVITGINILFYTVFGLCYIQYPRTYIIIEPMLTISSSVNNEESEMNSRSLSWIKLKFMILDEKYYLRPEVNIEEMAQYLKIGRTTLSNLINKEEKMNFHAWINTMRIEEAQQLFIANPDHSIAQVADMIGFSEPSNFSRQFKQITNQSPTVWKQKQTCKPEM